MSASPSLPHTVRPGAPAWHVRPCRRGPATLPTHHSDLTSLGVTLPQNNPGESSEPLVRSSIACVWETEGREAARRHGEPKRRGPQAPHPGVPEPGWIPNPQTPRLPSAQAPSMCRLLRAAEFGGWKPIR